MSDTVVVEGGGSDDAAVAFAAGAATVEAAVAVEEAAEATLVAEEAQALAEAALASSGGCCEHCAENQSRLSYLEDRMGSHDHPKIVEEINEVDDSMSPEVVVVENEAPVEESSKKTATKKPSKKTKSAYGNPSWFGR